MDLSKDFIDLEKFPNWMLKVADKIQKLPCSFRNNRCMEVSELDFHVLLKVLFRYMLIVYCR